MDNKYTRTTELITPKFRGKYIFNTLYSRLYVCHFFQSIIILCKNYMIELSNILVQENKPRI